MHDWIKELADLRKTVRDRSEAFKKIYCEFNADDDYPGLVHMNFKEDTIPPQSNDTKALTENERNFVRHLLHSANKRALLLQRDYEGLAKNYPAPELDYKPRKLHTGLIVKSNPL